MTIKIPPPPPIANLDPTFNRWLLELTSILAASGGIDPASVEGFEAALVQIAANTAAIAALQVGQGSQSGAIISLQFQINALAGNIATINGQITTLSARGEILFGVGAPAGGLGKVNDLYGRTDGPNRSVHIKTAVATWTQISANF